MKNYQVTLFSMPLLALIFSLLSAYIGKTALSLSCAIADPVATHNMLVVGEKTVYLSHLPMFQEKGRPPMPHRYQAIFEVSFSNRDSTAADDYRKDRLSHKKVPIYTLNPEPFVLTKLAASNPPAESIHKFSGSIFRGHLENGGQKILSDVEVNVNRVVYFQMFDPAAKRGSKLEYLLFGKGQELFLAHLITAPPDFDQVSSVTITGQSFTDEQLAKGIKVSFPRANTVSARLKEKEQAQGQFSIPGDSIAKKLQVNVTRNFYFEEGELRVPAVFDITKAEKKEQDSQNLRD